MIKLKTDPRYPYHYIIGVAMKQLQSKEPGKIYLKYGPLAFKNEDVEKMSEAITLSGDKIYTDIYRVSKQELCNMFGCTELIISFIGMREACRANMATMHHFSSDFELPNPEQYFEGLVERANQFKKERDYLESSRIKGY